MPRTSPRQQVLSSAEEEFLEQCLLAADPNADTAKALAETRRLISRYRKRLRSAENRISPAIEAERAATLSSQCFQLVRFLRFTDATTRQIAAEALSETTVGQIETLIEALGAVSGRAMVAQRAARRKIGPGAPVQREAERDLVFGLARIFTSATQTQVSVSKSKPYAKGKPLELRNAEKASRQFIEVVLRGALNIPEGTVGHKDEGANITEQTLRYWLREARHRVKADTAAEVGR